MLYRFFDADDELLYIGVTADISDRVRRHRSEKPWWTDVARMTLEHHPDRQSVELAERLAIAAEAPRWNVMHARPARPAPRVTDVERSTLRVTYGDTQIVWESAEPIEVLTQSTLAILRGINNG